MQKAFAVAIAAATSIVLAAVPAFAHHPFAPEFDWKKPVTLTGTVTKVEWMNPHALVSIDVRDASGTITNWALELGSPTVLEKHDLDEPSPLDMSVHWGEAVMPTSRSK